MADAQPLNRPGRPGETPGTDAKRRHDPEIRGFASDNYAGAHPEILAALALANGGHQSAYGADDYTEHLQG
ncbi:threonine aldolase, partial [Streptomyces nanshensis]